VPVEGERRLEHQARHEHQEDEVRGHPRAQGGERDGGDQTGEDHRRRPGTTHPSSLSSRWGQERQRAVELWIAILGSALKGISAKGAPFIPGFGTPAHIGRLFLTKYLFPFEVASLLLLVAAIGAVVLARRRRGLGNALDLDEGRPRAVLGVCGRFVQIEHRREREVHAVCA